MYPPGLCQSVFHHVPLHLNTVFRCVHGKGLAVGIDVVAVLSVFNEAEGVVFLDFLHRATGRGVIILQCAVGKGTDAKKNVHATQSEMMRSLDRLIQVVGFALIPVGCILFYRQFHVLGMDFRTSTQSTVAALIGMIPEGLYLLTSVAMAVSAMKLAQQKVLVQDMNCIETREFRS